MTLSGHWEWPNPSHDNLRACCQNHYILVASHTPTIHTLSPKSCGSVPKMKSKLQVKSSRLSQQDSLTSLLFPLSHSNNTDISYQECTHSCSCLKALQMQALLLMATRVSHSASLIHFFLDDLFSISGIGTIMYWGSTAFSALPPPGKWRHNTYTLTQYHHLALTQTDSYELSI